MRPLAEIAAAIRACEYFESTLRNEFADELDAIEDAREKAVPVAWLCDAQDGVNCDAVTSTHALATYVRAGRKITPLYAHPPAQGEPVAPDAWIGHKAIGGGHYDVRTIFAAPDEVADGAYNWHPYYAHPPAQPEPAKAKPVGGLFRFFLEHGLVHDRKTGKHIEDLTDESLLALLRELENDATAWRLTAKALEAALQSQPVKGEPVGVTDDGLVARLRAEATKISDDDNAHWLMRRDLFKGAANRIEEYKRADALQPQPVHALSALLRTELNALNFEVIARDIGADNTDWFLNRTAAIYKAIIASLPEGSK